MVLMILLISSLTSSSYTFVGDSFLCFGEGTGEDTAAAAVASLEVIGEGAGGDTEEASLA